MTSSTRRSKYVQCLGLDELPEPGRAVSRTAEGVAVCIVVDPKGSIFALEDKIPPHFNRQLSTGIVHSDSTIEDPILGTKFSLETGDVVGSWCPSGLGKLIGAMFEPVSIPTFPLRHKGRSLEVQLDLEDHPENRICQSF